MHRVNDVDQTYFRGNLEDEHTDHRRDVDRMRAVRVLSNPNTTATTWELL